MDSQAKEFIKSIPKAKLLTSLGIIIGLPLLIVILFSFGSSLRDSPIFIILFMTLFLLVTRLSILAKVGIGFVNIILFSTTLAFGPIPAILMILATSVVYIYIANRPTPIDFMITKGIQSAVAQTIYFSLWVLTLVPIFAILGKEFVLAHLTWTYMSCVLVYICYMLIFLPIIARDPLPIVIINGLIMVPIQFVVISYLGGPLIRMLMGA